MIHSPIMIRPILTTAFALTSTGLAAQVGVVPDNSVVLGITATTPQIVRHVVSNTGCLSAACPLPTGSGLVSNQLGRAGASAWDSRQSRMWVSNGDSLGLVAVGNQFACGVACAPFPAPLPAAGEVVTGLEFFSGGVGFLSNSGTPDALGTLFMSYSDQSIGWAPVNGCSVGATTFCDLGPALSGSRFIGGLAGDASRGLLFIGTSLPVSSSPANVVMVTSIEDPCNVLCVFTIPVDPAKCAGQRLGPITGLAFDSNRNVLYVTDGTVTIYGDLTVTKNAQDVFSCAFQHVGCCPSATTESLTGLAVRPRAPIAVGASCTSGSCGNCPNMRSTVKGDVVLGNAEFAFVLEHAPENASVVVFGLGMGKCNTRGFNLDFCGPILLPMAQPPALVGLGLVPSGMGCNRQVVLPVPVPVDRSFLSMELSAQWVVRCPNGGRAATDCITINVGGG